MNKVILLGNLGADPKKFGQSTVGCKFSLATSESYKDSSGEWQTKTEWHNITLWEKRAEYALKNLKKGNRVILEGKLQNHKWQADDGSDRITTYITGLSIQNLTPKDSGGSNSAPIPEDDLPF